MRTTITELWDDQVEGPFWGSAADVVYLGLAKCSMYIKAVNDLGTEAPVVGVRSASS